MTKVRVIKLFFLTFGIIAFGFSFVPVRASAQILAQTTVQTSSETVTATQSDVSSEVSTEAAAPLPAARPLIAIPTPTPEPRAETAVENPEPEPVTVTAPVIVPVLEPGDELPEPQPVPESTLSLTRVKKTDFRGHLGAESLLYIKPSGVAGQSQFQVPHAGLESHIEFAGGEAADFEVSYRSPVAAGVEFNVERASLTTSFGLGSRVQFRAGLFEPEWLRLADRFWPWERYSRDLDWASQRWGFGAAADYGFEIFRREDSWGFGAGVVNGEGLRQVEQGPQKDFFVWLSKDWGSPEDRLSQILFQAVRGGYENLPVGEAHKERYALTLRTRAANGLVFSCEGLLAGDPVDAVSLKIADQADLTDLGGERLSSRMLSTVLGYRFAHDRGYGWEFFMRSDDVELLKSDRQRGLVSSQIGFVYSSGPGIEWLLQMSNIDYGDRHSITARDEQTWRASFHVNWD